ncbi:hypothetical protein HNQ59_001974 [Chitinivorax tropicus]|uniref:Uncharacterized protein n=1 Tax=Chitinivorax tropicus TaxID=714531 RepID=A0A840MR50_9PROT|nr:hypothetical protein [Chitinivorax tropicus]
MQSAIKSTRPTPDTRSKATCHVEISGQIMRPACRSAASHLLDSLDTSHENYRKRLRKRLRMHIYKNTLVNPYQFVVCNCTSAHSIQLCQCVDPQ